MTEHRETFGSLFRFLPKSGLKAGEGQSAGRYPFFTSSAVQKKWVESPTHSAEALIFGTGGSASVHHVGDGVGFSTSGDCLVAVARHSDAIDVRYCYCYLSAHLHLLEAGFQGAGLKHVSKRFIEAIEIPVIPLAQQLRIVELLDRVDALRIDRRAALAQMDILLEAIFYELFGDPTRNDRAWPSGPVADVCKLVRGSSPRPQGDPRFFGGPVPRLMVADITRDGWSVTPQLDSLTVEGAKRSRPVPAGTVVMAVSGNVGLVSRLSIDACIHDGFVAFTQLDEFRLEPGFLLALLHLSKAAHEQHKAGAIFINLTTTDIKRMELPQPPILLQRDFVSRVAAVEHLRTAHRASLAGLDVLFAALQHRGFQGEL